LKDDFIISTDKSKIDIAAVHDYLSSIKSGSKIKSTNIGVAYILKVDDQEQQ